MKSSRLFQNVIIILVLIFNIGCDQMSKNIVRNTIDFDQKINLLNNHVMFTRVENSGAFLSLGHTLSTRVKFVILIIVPFMALLVGLYYLFVGSALSRSTSLALSFVVGGGFGNIYDRYTYGSVTDFMHVDFVLFRTGIFNMADVSIMTGVFIILASFILKSNRSAMNLGPEDVV